MCAAFLKIDYNMLEKESCMCLNIGCWKPWLRLAKLIFFLTVDVKVLALCIPPNNISEEKRYGSAIIGLGVILR